MKPISPAPISPSYVATIVTVFLLAFGGTVWYLRYEPLPDFGALEVPAKKLQFFAFLGPKIEAANIHISQDRQRLMAIALDLGS